MIETRICTEVGIDLFEIQRWPTWKKLVYANHFKAYDDAQRAQQEKIDPGDFDTSDVPKSTKDLQKKLKNRGQNKQSANHHGRSDIHPALRKYPKVVNVQNPGEKLGRERIAEIMRKPELEHEEPPDPIGGDGVEVRGISTSDPDGIEQLSDGVEQPSDTDE